MRIGTARPGASTIYYVNTPIGGDCSRKKPQDICVGIQQWWSIRAASFTEQAGRRMRCLKKLIFSRRRARQPERADSAIKTTFNCKPNRFNQGQINFLQSENCSPNG